MKMRIFSFARIVYCLIFIFVLSSFFFRLWPAESAPSAEINADLPDNYDIRLDRSISAREAISRFAGQTGTSFSRIEAERKNVLQAVEKLRGRQPYLKIEDNEDLRIPEVISPDFAQKSSFLTAPTVEKRADVLKNFITQNAEIFGLDRAQIDRLEKTADYTNPDGDLSFVQFEQKINSIPVFRGEIKAGFTRRGELVRVINNLAPNLDETNLPTVGRSAEEAVADAANFIDVRATEADTKRIETAPGDLKITFGRGQFADQTTAEKIYFPLDRGVARLAWRVLLWQKTNAFYVIVDAEGGTLLWRKNITDYQTQSATYNVYAALLNPSRTADSPTPMTPGCTDPNNCPQPPIIQRSSVTLVGNEPPNQFNNLGWIPDNRNYTDGNNAEAGIDRDGVNGVDPNGYAFGSPNRNFVYTYNPAPGSPPPGEEPVPPTQPYPPTQFQQGSVTNAFYVVNRFHDELYRLGFTESARNFQNDNFNRGGAGNDRISVEVQDSSGTNNANFSTPADGARPRLQLYVYTGTTPNRDGALDNQAIVHELMHGVSNRLHANGSGLGTTMGSGMGEGWSDFFALALLSESQDELFATYPLESYSIAGLSTVPGDYYYGVRRFPTAIRAFRGANGFPHNPLTFANLNQGNCTAFESAFPPRNAVANCSQAQYIGEVWSAALWEVRARFVARLGLFPGNQKTMQIILDGMKLAPLNPTILQERDAIITAAFAGASSSQDAAIDAADVWRGFATRGLGYGAQITTSSPLSVVEAFNLPPNLLRPKRADFDGDGKTDLSVFRPSEGNWYLNRSTAGFTALHWGLEGDVPVPADYDADGKTDIAVFRGTADSSLPDFYVLNSSNSTFTAYGWGLPGDVPLVEDYDGDEKADVCIYRPSESKFYMLRSQSGTVFTDQASYPATYKAVAGDFDGDGKADYGFFGDGKWLLAKSGAPNAGFAVTNWGIATDTPVAADFDGDSIDDLAVYRASEGNWYVRRASGGNIVTHFGIASDIPVPGDYDGDGKTDIAVYRDGTWYINRTNAGLLITQFGLASDLPIPSRY